MRTYVPRGHAHQVVALRDDIERMRNALASLTADLERLNGRLQDLTRDRRSTTLRDALSVLRRSPAPMGLRALTITLMAVRGVDMTDGALVNRLMEQLRVSLLRQWRAGIVHREKGSGLTVVWSISG